MACIRRAWTFGAGADERRVRHREVDGGAGGTGDIARQGGGGAGEWSEGGTAAEGGVSWVLCPWSAVSLECPEFAVPPDLLRGVDEVAYFANARMRLRIGTKLSSNGSCSAVCVS